MGFLQWEGTKSSIYHSQDGYFLLCRNRVDNNLGYARRQFSPGSDLGSALLGFMDYTNRRAGFGFDEHIRLEWMSQGHEMVATSLVLQVPPNEISSRRGFYAGMPTCRGSYDDDVLVVIVDLQLLDNPT
jgi:hypothetical protein